MKTEIIGFSQTYQWYTGQELSLLDAGLLGSLQFFLNPAKGVKKANVFLEKYATIHNEVQARFRFGGDLSLWKNRAFDGWHGGSMHHMIYEKKEVERVIFQISGKTRSTLQWQNDIKEVIEHIRSYYPHVKELYLQPVIGSHAQNTQIRAIKNQPAITRAIQERVEKDTTGVIKAGPVLFLQKTQFSDRIGHLTEQGAQQAQKMIFTFYHFYDKE